MKGARRRRGQKRRWEDNIKEWTGIEFGDSMWAAVERYCCNVITGAPTTPDEMRCSSDIVFTLKIIFILIRIVWCPAVCHLFTL